MGRFPGWLLVLLVLVAGALTWRLRAPPPLPAPAPSPVAQPTADVPAAPPVPTPSQRPSVRPGASTPRPEHPVAVPGASAVAREFWRETDLLAFVDRHLDAALAGDAEAQYFVAMAQQACVPAVGRPTLTGDPAAIEAWLARRPGLSDEQAASYRRRLRQCVGFAAAYGGEDEAEALDEGAESLLRAAADAGHPAAVVELRMWVTEGWRDGPGRDAVLDDLGAAAASAHPEALYRLGDYLGGDAGLALTLLACDAGYDCAPDAPWVIEYCQFPWSVCGLEADGPAAILDSLPTWRAESLRVQVASLRGGSADAYRRFLGAALDPGAGLPTE